MQDSRCIRNLALIGFMGSGKSSVGRWVARRLRFAFLDTDEWITARAGKSIPQLFAEDGEARFRQYENDAVAALLACRRTVIATGGGLVAHADHLASLRTHALIVCLWASPEQLWERTRHQAHRPLLQTPEPLARIRELLAQREPYYRQADVLIHTERRSVEEIARLVIAQFRLALDDQLPP